MSRKQCHFCFCILQCPLWFVWGGTIYDKNTGLPAIDLALFILAPGCFLSNSELLLLWPLVLSVPELLTRQALCVYIPTIQTGQLMLGIDLLIIPDLENAYQ